MMQHKRPQNPNEVPDSVSFYDLLKTIIPHQRSNGSIDFRGRCECEECLHERKKLLDSLQENIRKDHFIKASQNCPQRICRTISEDKWAEIEKEHCSEKSQQVKSEEEKNGYVEETFTPTDSVEYIVISFDNGVVTAIPSEISGMLMTSEVDEDEEDEEDGEDE